MNKLPQIVFIFENQFTQYELLEKNLGYSVFPDSIDNFIRLMDHVRVFLNPGYGKYDPEYDQPSTVREMAFDYILRKVKEVGPAVILMDHILVGNHSSEDGIFLAGELQKKGKIKLPIIFLSRTDASEFKVMANFPKLADPKDWLNKGYAGKKFSDLDYIKNIVEKKIQERILLSKDSVSELDQNEQDRLLNLLDELLSPTYSSRLRSKRIISNRSHPQAAYEMGLIKAFINNGKPIGSEINLLLNKLVEQ